MRSIHGKSCRAQESQGVQEVCDFFLLPLISISPAVILSTQSQVAICLVDEKHKQVAVTHRPDELLLPATN
jgi:hypothetical protein